jgi:hypothetical protein
LLCVYFRDVAGVAGAVQILLVAGFADGGDTLVLRRFDVGLLYVVASTLQNITEVVHGTAAGGGESNSS